MIEVREFLESDWPAYASWWEARGASPPPASILPKLGRVVEVDGVACAAGFLYLDATGSGVAWLGWFATDPQSSPLRNGRAMNALVGCMEDVARTLDYGVIFSTVADPLPKFFHRSGYQSGDSNMTHLFKTLR